jgi:hypothetical protein
MQAKFGRMVMCHMIADTEAELHAMAAKIGVARRWYQGDHYDVCLSKRTKAVMLGAQQITCRDCGLMMVLRHRDHSAPLVTPEEGIAIIAGRAA